MSFPNKDDCCFGAPSNLNPNPPRKRNRECADPSQRVDLRHQCRDELLFLNSAQSFTANCPVGYVGDPVTVTVPAGLVPSEISVEDANSAALEYAQEVAESQLQCQGLFYNQPQTATVACLFGPAQQYTTPEGQFTSAVSQAAANALAYAYAAEQAQSQCTGNPSPGDFLTGGTAIGPSDLIVTVNFSQTLAQVPSFVNGVVTMPDGSGSNIFATLILSSITATGCQFSLSAPTGNAGSTLEWSVFVPSSTGTQRPQQFSASIPVGVFTVNVTFPLPFVSPPNTIIPVVEMPDDTGDNIFATLIKGSVTTTGCQFSISGAAPTTGYLINGLAFQ